jgi:hypothetical protein
MRLLGVYLGSIGVIGVYRSYREDILMAHTHNQAYVLARQVNCPCTQTYKGSAYNFTQIYEARYLIGDTAKSMTACDRWAQSDARVRWRR